MSMAGSMGWAMGRADRPWAWVGEDDGGLFSSVRRDVLGRPNVKCWWFPEEEKEKFELGV